MIRCYKQGMTMVGILDDFISFTFSRSYSGLGTWDLEVDGNSLNAQRITGMDFISVSDGVAGLVTRESRDGDILSFHGVELKGLAYTRIIVPVTGDAYLNYNNKTPEYIIHDLITSQIVNPENSDRKILDTAVNVPSVLSTGITKQYRFKNLGESIEELALAYNLGWYADIQDGVITFSIYAGKDRTAAQAVNDRLILSRDRDTIVNAEHIVNKNIPKTALVAGQGEGTGRAIVMIGDDLADLQRNEVYIDARDIEDAANLPSRGIERLADYSTEDVYNVSLGRILVDQYRVNYDLGDIGTLSEINADARLTEITEVYEDNVLELKSVFGRDAVRLKNVINKIYSETESIVNKEGVTTSDITDFPATMPPSEHNHDAAYLGITAKAADSDQLDGNEASAFAAAEHNQSADTITTGTLGVERGGTGVTTAEEIALMSYPVGAIYQSTVSTSPATLFGGTWAAIGGMFLLGADGTYAAGSTGGAATQTHALSDNAYAQIRVAGGYNVAGRTVSGKPNTSIDYGSIGAGGAAGNMNEGTPLRGNTDSASNMPPYLSVYMWERTA